MSGLSRKFKEGDRVIVKRDRGIFSLNGKKFEDSYGTVYYNVYPDRVMVKFYHPYFDNGFMISYDEDRLCYNKQWYREIRLNKILDSNIGGGL